MSIADKLTTIAENVQKVYEAGKAAGGGYDEGYTDGKQAAYDLFWDAYQENGNRTSYVHGFCGDGWTNELFKPKYTLENLITISYMFRYCRLSGDLAKLFEDLGLAFSFIGNDAQRPFCDMKYVTRLFTIDCAKARNIVYDRWFSGNTDLVTIDKIILANNNDSATFTGCFDGCPCLQDIEFEGVIGTSISFQFSPLSVDSMKNVISCLKNYAGTSSEFDYKVTFKEDCWTALEAETRDDGLTWREYVDSLGWNT